MQLIWRINFHYGSNFLSILPASVLSLEDSSLLSILSPSVLSLEDFRIFFKA